MVQKFPSLTKKELAEKYNVSGKTLKTWIKPLGLKTGKRQIYKPIEVQKIFEFLGEP